MINFIIISNNYKMIIPVRCFTCGKVTGNKYTQYKTLLEAGMNFDDIMKEINMTRMCCKRMFHTQVDCADEFAQYDTLPVTVKRTESVDHARQYIAR